MDAQMLKDVYVVIESCRSAFDLLHEYLPVFLARHMEVSASAYDKDGVAAWWRCMGVGAEWADLLAEVNPMYGRGKLLVSEMVYGKVVSADQVGDILLYICMFSKFSTTRWCSVGKSCRSLFAAVSVGLLPLALLALQLKGRLETKLHGVKKLNDDIRWYLAVASIVTWIPEAFEVAVAEDDRICRRLEELEEVVQQELDYVFRIEKFVWLRLAFVANGAVVGGRAQRCMYPSMPPECCFSCAESLLSREGFALVSDLRRCGAEFGPAARGARACQRPCNPEDSQALGARSV